MGTGKPWFDNVDLRHQHPKHRQPHRWRTCNLISNTCTVNAARATSLLANRRPYPQNENLQRSVRFLIAGTRTTSSPMLGPSTSLPTSPTSTLLASLASMGFTMTEALPSIGWRPAPPPHLTASLTLPTLSAPQPKSATPNQGLPTSTSSEPPQLSLPTPAPLMLYGQPCFQHPHRKCRRHNLITCTRKTSCLRSPSNPVDHTAHRIHMAHRSHTAHHAHTDHRGCLPPCPQ